MFFSLTRLAKQLAICYPLRTRSPAIPRNCFNSHARRFFIRPELANRIRNIEEAVAEAMSAISTTSSGKRKRNGPKFYAVRKGRTPGIYYSWPECQKQTDGVAAEFKSFPTLGEAEAYMSGANNTAKVNKPVTYYGVANGLVPGVYTDYASVLAQTNGVSGAKHKSFTTREEAQAFVNDFQRGRSAPISLRGDLSETSSMVISKELKAGDTSTKKSKKTETVAAVLNGDVKWEPGYGPIPPDAEDGFDPTIKLDPDTGNIRVKTEQELSMTKLQPTGDISGPIVVYTDGSSLGNGKIGAVGGVGVYFGPNDARNLSEALRGSRQTNQRAELTAVARALDHIPIDRSTIILTDSRYSIQCLTEWFPKWEKNNWKSSSGKDVENRDLIEPIIARMRERAMCKAQTKLEWLKGHANHPGNVAADRLAVQGSRTSTPELRSVKEFSATLMTPIGVEQRIETMHESQQVAAAGSLGNAWQPQTTSQAPSMSWSAGADDGGAEFDEIFAELAAEREQLPPSVAVTQLSEAGAKEGQATDAMDVARDGGEGA